MRRDNGILWKVKEIEVMTEKTVQTFLGFLDPTDYRPSVMTLLFLKRLNDTCEENEEKLIQADRNEKEAYCQITTCSQSEDTCNRNKNN
jgi:type I restriction-modification system DNA methylase subunit